MSYKSIKWKDSARSCAVGYRVNLICGVLQCFGEKLLTLPLETTRLRIHTTTQINLALKMKTLRPIKAIDD